jgi:hypothetical protein
MTIQSRIKLEKRIVRKLVKALLASGYELTVNNGGDENEIPWTSSFKAVTDALFATDSEHLLTRKDGRQSFVYLVYGNDGYDAVVDYGVSLDPIVGPINNWACELEVH